MTLLRRLGERALVAILQRVPPADLIAAVEEARRRRREPRRRHPWRLRLTPEQRALADRHLAVVRRERASAAGGRYDLQLRHKRGNR
jgi:hypothetical protein